MHSSIGKPQKSSLFSGPSTKALTPPSFELNGQSFFGLFTSLKKIRFLRIPIFAKAYQDTLLFPALANTLNASGLARRGDFPQVEEVKTLLGAKLHFWRTLWSCCFRPSIFKHTISMLKIIKMSNNHQPP